MASKKKPKIKIEKDAFKNIPEEDREEVKKDILEAFSDMDKAIEESVAVEVLPEGANECTKCGGKLEAGPVITIPPDNEVIQIFHCVECWQPFQGKPLN